MGAILPHMAAELLKRYSIAEYLALERRADTKSEYYHGEIFGIPRANREHCIVVSAIIAALHPLIKAREMYASRMRLRVAATDFFTYPDIVITCDQPQFDDDEFDTLLNPTFLVEVLSPSTEDYDRGRKFAHYRTLPSLLGYLLVAQDRVHVEYFARQADGRWVLTEADDITTVLDLEGVGCRLALAEVYGRMPAGWPDGSS